MTWSRWSVAIVMGLALLAAMTVEPPRGVEAASLRLTWDAPTTNVSGTQLTDLAGYIVGVATSELHSSAPGTWDTNAVTSARIFGAARTLDFRCSPTHS